MKAILSVLVSLGVLASFLVTFATLEWENVEWIATPPPEAWRTRVSLDACEYDVGGGRIIQVGLREDGVVVWRDKP